MYANFTFDQIRDCLKLGEIIMTNNNNSQQLILIPIKLISGIIGIKYVSQNIDSARSSDSSN